MAGNFIQPGDTLTATAPYDRASGEGMLCGALFCIALAAVLSGAQVEAAAKPGSIWLLPKATGEAWTFGAKLYWDNTNKRLTTTSSGNTLVGTAAKAAASGDTTGQFRYGLVA